MSTNRRRHIPLVEKAAVGISAVLVFATVGYLAYESLRGTAEEPVLTVEIAQVNQRPDAVAVVVEVRNGSSRTAADVQIVGSDPSSDGQGNEAHASLDYVPGRSTRRVTLMFAPPPASPPRIRVAGYTTP